MKGENPGDGARVSRPGHDDDDMAEEYVGADSRIAANILDWVLTAAAPEQRAYLGAKLQFDRIVEEHDRLLAPIDLGEVTTLTMAELDALEHLQPAHLAICRVLLAAERQLLIFAREWLRARPEILALYPQYELVLDVPSPTRREMVLIMAACWVLRRWKIEG